jgi:lysophospholipase L1-like esterase
MSGKANIQSQERTRRDFVRAGLGFTSAGLAGFGLLAQASAKEASTANDQRKPLIKDGDIVLFQGDSITDAGRKRDVSAANSDAALGRGYAWLTAARLLIGEPDKKLKIYNRGVSGNKVYQLAERWKTDCLDLKPDVLSILIGVNDFWHKLKHDYSGTLETYERDYKSLIKRTKDALPDVKLVICEPFVLKVGHVDESWFPEFNRYRDAAKRVADEAGAVFVRFQTMFDAAVKIASPELWAKDGVHPTDDGASIMAEWWLKAVGG